MTKIRQTGTTSRQGTKVISTVAEKDNRVFRSPFTVHGWHLAVRGSCSAVPTRLSIEFPCHMGGYPAMRHNEICGHSWLREGFVLRGSQFVVRSS